MLAAADHIQIALMRIAGQLTLVGRVDTVVHLRQTLAQCQFEHLRVVSVRGQQELVHIITLQQTYFHANSFHQNGAVTPAA